MTNNLSEHDGKTVVSTASKRNTHGFHEDSIAKKHLIYVRTPTSHHNDLQSNASQPEPLPSSHSAFPPTPKLAPQKALHRNARRPQAHRHTLHPASHQRSALWTLDRSSAYRVFPAIAIHAAEAGTSTSSTASRRSSTSAMHSSPQSKEPHQLPPARQTSFDFSFPDMLASQGGPIRRVAGGQIPAPVVALVCIGQHMRQGRRLSLEKAIRGR